MPIDYIFNGTPQGGASGPALALDETAGELYFVTQKSGGWKPITGGGGGGGSFTTAVTIAPATDVVALTVTGDVTQDSNIVEVHDGSGNPLVTIDSTGVSTFNAAMLVSGTVTCSTINPDVIQIATGSDVTGRLVLAQGTTSVSYVYNITPVSHQPTVVVTAEGSNPAALGAVWVTHNGGALNWTGFTLHAASADAGAAHTFVFHLFQF